MDHPKKRHHHRHPHHHPHHHHPHHSGDGGLGDVIDNSTTNHQHTHYHETPLQEPLQACLAAVRGLASAEQRIALLARLLSSARHEDLIPGFAQVMLRSMQQIDHYGHPPESRSY